MKQMTLNEAKRIVKRNGYMIKESAGSIRAAIQDAFPDLDYVVDSEGESQGSARFVDGNGHYLQVDALGDGAFNATIWSGKKMGAEEEVGSMDELLAFVEDWVTGEY